MIGASYKHRDGGWSVSIHGEPADLKAFEELMQWILEHEVSVKETEMSEETKRYKEMKQILQTLPDVDAFLKVMSEKTKLAKSVILSKALMVYDLVYSAVSTGDRVVIKKAVGEEIEVSPGFL